MGGDPRALYMLWLCAAYDDNEDPAEMIEPPVPHGLDKMPARSARMLPFFGVDPLILKAAAQGIPDSKPVKDDQDPIQVWSDSLGDGRSRELLRRFLKEDPASVKAELLAEIRDAQSPADWPVAIRKRSLDDLFTATEALRESADEKAKRKAESIAKRETAKAEKERQARMMKMKDSPKTWLAQAEKTAAAGGIHNYQAAAEILADLREAISGEEGKQLAHACATKIAKAHPTLSMLKSSLKKQGLLE